MWNMMCDVMPTISEDSISQRSSQLSGEDANFEQLMVSMLDERDKLVESLRETQERLGDSELRLKEVEKERDSLHRQIAANLPQVISTSRNVEKTFTKMHFQTNPIFITARHFPSKKLEVFQCIGLHT
ncbi:hypothetical protein B5X24_HaOG201747 [Helicoverpa armigera]|nr:hypothetical protein B5X24_HaOG201747 [Helicoverpa armigera]